LERGGFTVQQLRDCGSDLIRGDNQSPVQMDIALSYASDGVTVCGPAANDDQGAQPEAST